MLKQRLDEAQVKNANLMHEVSDLKRQVRATGERKVDTEPQNRRAASTPMNERISVPGLTIPSNKEESKFRDVRDTTPASTATSVVDSGRPPPRCLETISNYSQIYYQLISMPSILTCDFQFICSFEGPGYSPQRLLVDRS